VTGGRTNREVATCRALAKGGKNFPPKFSNFLGRRESSGEAEKRLGQENLAVDNFLKNLKVEIQLNLLSAFYIKYFRLGRFLTSFTFMDPLGSQRNHR
jgi:hypothetical protein